MTSIRPAEPPQPLPYPLPVAGAADPAAERAYHRRIRAWTMYDWGDHAYITTTASTFFPPYFVAIAAPAFLAAGAASNRPAGALARDTASNFYAFTVSAALLLAALLAPIIGTYADITGRRKRLLVAATVVGALLASLMFTLVTGRWVLGLVLYFATQVSLNIALGLNSSLLPHIARPGDLGRVSSLGYAMGYVGGGVLLLLCTILYLAGSRFGISDALAIRIAFLTVGIWWIVFTIPLILRVAEPPATPLAGSRGNTFSDTFVRLRHTVADIRRYRELFKMLIAFWLYSEGIGAIILLATAYGAALGLGTAILIATLLMTQFVAFPYALIYGRISDPTSKQRAVFVSMLLWTAVTFPLMGIYLNRSGNVGVGWTFAFIAANQALGILFSFLAGRQLVAGLTARLDTKRAVILGLAIYTIIPIWGFFLRSQAEFFMIGWLVGTVQGGTQALSRAIYADLSPRRKSGEFFGLYGLSEKFAGILGPLLYGIVGQITHDPRASILSISAFFLVGMYLLWHVNERVGKSVAQEEDARIEAVAAAD